MCGLEERLHNKWSNLLCGYENHLDNNLSRILFVWCFNWEDVLRALGNTSTTMCISRTKCTLLHWV